MLAEIPCSAERRMSGKRQFCIDGENAYLNPVALLSRFVAREDVGRLAKVGFLSQLLHLVIAETAGVGEHRQLVAFQRPVGEDIKLNEIECTLAHSQKAPRTIYQDSANLLCRARHQPKKPFTCS